MGKTTFSTANGVNQKLLGAFAYEVAVVAIDPTRDFLNVGTPNDPRNNVKFDVSGNDLK